MPSLTEEILVTLQGRDNASQVVNGFASNAESTLNGVSSGATDMGSAYSSTFDSIGQGIHTLNSGMISLSSLNRTVMSELGSQKSAMDWVYGTTSKEDTNKVLVKNMAKTQEEYDSLYGTIDKVTDSSLTSMQDLIPALNAFRSATQATAGQLETDVTEDMANFGAFVLAQTGSTQLALTAMMDLSKGIKGRYASLDQYGVSADALKATGLWKEAEGGSKTKNWTGDEKDIKGYMDAVTAVIGDTEELMNTNEGLNAQMGKMWSRAGKRIGHEMMPGLKSLKQMFIDMDTEMNGDLSTGVLRVALAIEEAQQKAFTLNTLYDATRNLSSIVKAVATHFGLMSAETGANTAQTQANSQAIQENTRQLLANSDARLANAEASGIMGNAQMMTPNGTMRGTGGTTSELMDDATFIGTDTATDALMGKMGGSPYGNDAIGKELYRREQQAKDTAKKIEETSKFEEKVANRAKLFDKYKKVKEDTKTRDETYGLSKYLETTGENTQIADVLRKNKEERKKLSGAIGGTTDENIITDLKSKLTKNRQESLKLAQGQQYTSDIEKSLSGLVGRGVDANLINKSTEAYQKNLIREVNPPTTFTGLFRKKLDGFGTTLQDGLEKGFGGIGTNLGKAKKGANLTSIKTKISDLFFDYEHDLTQDIEKRKLKVPKLPKFSLSDLNEKLGKSFEGLSLSGAIGSLKNFVGRIPIIGSLLGLGTAELEVVDAELAGAEAVVTTTGAEAEAVGASSAVAGAEAESASAGVGILGLGGMTLAEAFSTLIVPILAIAGVIAVMIPIVAGLAIEALFFINLVGQVMSAMKFDGIDTDGAVEALQNIATALAWLGVAMLSLTFVGLTATMGMVTAGLLNLFGGIPMLVGVVSQIGAELEPLNDMETIDDSAVENLQNIGNILNSLSMVMLSFTGLQLSVGLSTVLDGFGLFSAMFGDAITRAKDDISKAIEAINGINFGSIDTQKAEQVKTTMEAINAFADAFSGLTKIRTDNAISDFVAWLLDGGIFGQGGKSIAEAFSLAQTDIQEASQAISQFTGITDIDQTTVDRLTKVGEAIKAMGDAFEGLRKIRDDTNWDAMFEDGGWLEMFQGKHDIASALNQAKGTMIKISKSLKQLDGKLADIPDDVANKLKKVSETLTSVTTILDNMKKLNEEGGNKNKNFDKYVETIKQAKSSIIKVSKELKSMDGNGEGKGGIEDIANTGVAEKLDAVTRTLTNVAQAISNLKEIYGYTNQGKDIDGYVTMIKDARTSLIQISKELKNMDKGEGDGGLSDITDSGLDGKLKAVTSVLTNIAKSVEQLNTINSTTNGGSNFSNYTTMINNAKTALHNVSNTLKDMGDGKGDDDVLDIDEGLASKIDSVSRILYNIAQALTNLKEIDKGVGSAQGEGFTKYRTVIYNAKEGLHNVSKTLKDMKIEDIDDGKAEQITKVTTTLQKINEAMTEMQTIFDEFGGNKQTPSDGTMSARDMVNAESESGTSKGDNVSNIENYRKTVENSITAIKTIAPTLKNLNTDKSLEGLDGLGQKIGTFKRALSKLSSTATVMQGFPVVRGDTIGYRVARAVTGLKRASAQMKKLNDNDKVGDNIKGIIKDIKGALKDLKRAVEATNMKPAGKSVGGSIVKGIGSGMGNLTSTVTGKIQSSTRGSASAGWTMGATIADSVNRGFASALKFSDIINQQVQQAQISASGAGAGVGIGGVSGSTGSSTPNDSAHPSSSSSSAESNPAGGIIYRNTRAMLNNMSSAYKNISLNRFNNNRRQGLTEMNKTSNMGQEKQSVNIIVSEGAVQMDARNLTKKESRQVMINALEGLDMVHSIKLKNQK